MRRFAHVIHTESHMRMCGGKDRFFLTSVFLARSDWRLLASQAQRWAPLVLGSAETTFLVGNVVSGNGHNTLPLGDLDLHHHHVLLTERHLGSCKIKFPHPHEAPVVNALGFFTMCQKPLAPVL